MAKSKQHRRNKKTVAELFEKRTGVKYENHIQAQAVQKKIEKEYLEIVVPYATETTTQTINVIRWSK
tara:strand:+ start:1390 stop:1590 length:201 start_codon:yes stop_codon:yes gene_type:complete